MKYGFIILLLLATLSSSAQIKRAFLTHDGTYTAKPKKASCYILIQKLEDTAYIMRMYDMHDTILMQGTFRDELMTVPEGKFLFYRKNYYNMRFRSPNEILDTNNYVCQVGYFLNGAVNGTWISYSSKGVIRSISTFENGKLNGLYQSIIDGNILEGNFSNNKKEGNWRKHRIADTLLLEEANFKHDTLLDKKIYWRSAIERGSLNEFLAKQLKQYRKMLADHYPIISYKINTKGRIVEPQLIKGVNAQVDAAIIKAFVDAPAYYPASYNYIPVEEKITRILYLDPAPNYYANSGFDMYQSSYIFSSMHMENGVFTPFTRVRYGSMH